MILAMLMVTVSYVAKGVDGKSYVGEHESHLTLVQNTSLTTAFKDGLKRTIVKSDVVATS